MNISYPYPYSYSYVRTHAAPVNFVCTHRLCSLSIRLFTHFILGERDPGSRNIKLENRSDPSAITIGNLGKMTKWNSQPLYFCETVFIRFWSSSRTFLFFLREGVKKRNYLGLSPKLWVGGGQES